jgi:hypothetical protein
MKKKTILALSSAVAVALLMSSLAGTSILELAKAEGTTAQSCADITFGTATNSSDTTTITTNSFSALNITINSVTSSTAFCPNTNKTATTAARLGSGSNAGSLVFTFSQSLVITKVKVLAWLYGSDTGSTITVTSSAQSASSAQTITCMSAPDIRDSSTDLGYVFTDLDAGAKTPSSSLTITGAKGKRFYLAKIVLTLNGSGSAASSSSSSTPAGTLTKSLTSSNSTLSTSYTTGNYSTMSIDSISYGYYRAYKDSGTVGRLIAPSYTGSLSGSLYNIDSIEGITSITLNYKTASASDSTAKLFTGSSSLLSSSQAIPASMTSVSKAFTFASTEGIGFFRIDCGSSDLTVNSLTIAYIGTGSATTSYGSSGEGLYRINPKAFSGSLVSGSSSVSVPQTITVSGSSYTTTTSKTYTYYSYSAVAADSSLASAAAYTEPQDVAAYFIAFHTYPANYVTSANYSAAYSFFGNKTRCVSSYTRTDGYVTALPYQASGTSIDTYYECDIAMDSTYSSSSRGTGRVVVFTGGFDTSKGATSYDSSYVAVFTDDHYATFKEYYNYGGTFSIRFDAELFRTSYQYGAPTTLA